MKEKKTKEAGSMVRLHNKGRRDHFLKNGVRSVPGRAIDVPAELAKFYIETYPESFILFDDLGSLQAVKGDVKKLTKHNKDLEIENEALLARIKELEANGSEDESEPEPETEPKAKAKTKAKNEDSSSK